MKLILALLFYVSTSAYALTDGTVLGTVTDPDGVALSGAHVELLDPAGKIIKNAKTSLTGEFTFFPVAIGNYQVRITGAKLAPFLTNISVSTGATTLVDAHMTNAKKDGEMVLQVRAKRHLVSQAGPPSSTEMDQSEIKQLPQGDDITLPKLFATTTPGAVQGAFGQTFFRGNHANIQYQIDGVQLPDSPSNTFGQAFSPRNVDHMEVITGGIPAEYGERLAAVVNMVTKSGTETPGGSAQLDYGSYQTFTPTLTYGGSNESGRLHYFASANYMTTNRGIDTPQPTSEGNQKTGGEDAVHDHAESNTEFLKLDGQLNNSNKLTFEGFYAQNYLQIPNYPSSFHQNDPYFGSTFVDSFGNGPGPFIYTPPNTNDYQEETNAFAQIVWKHTFNDHAFLQIAPYFKYSYIHFQNDPVNDLISGADGAYSFFESRNTLNYGLKGDYTERFSEKHLFKTGFQVQNSQADGRISVQHQTVSNAPTEDSGTDRGAFESLYAQDDWTFSPRWTLNAGLRFDATQFSFSDTHPTESMLQPRIGLSYMPTDSTKLHAFYGKLFQPAPLENLRSTLSQTSGGQLTPYDIRAEKDDYFEVGLAQQYLETQVVTLNVYYKNAKDMLDDTQLFNTSIAQPYNFDKGYAYGVELSLKGDITPRWSEYLNYSYEIAKGKGLAGGLFAFPGGANAPGQDWTMLDHVQVQTANAGLTYHLSQFYWTGQALFGSGLRTGPDNNASLPSHLTFDTTVGYEFRGDSWLSRWKVSGDILNLLDNPYAISVANGFNGSHYAAGREFFIRLTKAL